MPEIYYFILTRSTNILNTPGQVFITGNIELAKYRSNYAIKELSLEFILGWTRQGCKKKNLKSERHFTSFISEAQWGG